MTQLSTLEPAHVYNVSRVDGDYVWVEGCDWDGFYWTEYRLARPGEAGCDPKE